MDVMVLFSNKRVLNEKSRFTLVLMFTLMLSIFMLWGHGAQDAEAAPTISIGSPSASLTQGGPVTYTITYSGADTVTLANGDVTLNTTGTATGTIDVTGTDTTTRIVTLSSITGDGTLGISIAAATASDLASNTAPASGPSATFTVDNTAPVFSSTSPAAASYINTATVGYTLSEDVVSGTITFTSTGGTADGSSPHVYPLSGPDITAGSHSIATGLTLVNGAIYTVSFDGADAAGNVASTVSNTNVLFDASAASVTLTSPPSSSSTNTATAGYTLSKDIASGNIVYTQTGGAGDGASPHLYALSGPDLTNGSHTVITGFSLVDGTVYTVSIENVVDLEGNISAIVSNTSITFDTTAVAFTNTSPAASSTIHNAIVSYTLSEQAAAGTVIFTQTSGTSDPGSPHIFNLTGTNLNAGDHLAVDTGQILLDGAIYTVSFDATDMAGNHATTVSNAGVMAVLSELVSASADTNGSISPTGSVVVNYGADQVFTITPAANYHVADVLVDGVTAGAVTSYTFTNVTTNHTISASFAINTQTITASAGGNGSISPTGSVVVNYGADQVFTITPAANYHVADVLVDGVTAGAVTSYTFTNVTTNHTISASFAINTQTITASAGGNGSISPTGSVVVNYGADQVFTITPAANYHVADVLVDGVTAGAVTSYTFTNVTTNHTISASFAINTQTITASAGGNGSISPTGSVVVNYGADQVFTITPAANYHVADVLVDGVTAGAVTSYTFTNVTTNHTISASFAINTQTITASAGGNGSISPTGSVVVNYGTDQVFTITPAANYHVADVLVDGVTAGAVTSYTFTNVTTNHTISASFAINTQTITASAGGNGSISPTGSVVVNYGADQVFTITPAANYHVADVLVDGVTAGAVTSYTFTNVTTNHTISASFAINTQTITASAGGNGSISPTGSVVVNYGADQVFTITPAANYHVADVLVDGVTAGAVTSYTFTNVTTNHTISASFAINTQTITASAGGNGSISPTGSVVVNYGAARCSRSPRSELPRSGRARRRRHSGSGNELHRSELPRGGCARRTASRLVR